MDGEGGAWDEGVGFEVREGGEEGDVEVVGELRWEEEQK